MSVRDRIAAGVLLPWVAATVQLLVSGAPGSHPAAVRAWTAMALSSLAEDGLLEPVIPGRHHFTDAVVGASIGAAAGAIALRLPLEGDAGPGDRC